MPIKKIIRIIGGRQWRNLQRIFMFYSNHFTLLCFDKCRDKQSTWVDTHGDWCWRGIRSIKCYVRQGLWKGRRSCWILCWFAMGYLKEQGGGNQFPHSSRRRQNFKILGSTPQILYHGIYQYSRERPTIDIIFNWCFVPAYGRHFTPKLKDWRDK